MSGKITKRWRRRLVGSHIRPEMQSDTQYAINLTAVSSFHHSAYSSSAYYVGFDSVILGGATSVGTWTVVWIDARGNVACQPWEAKGKPWPSHGLGKSLAVAGEL